MSGCVSVWPQNVVILLVIALNGRLYYMKDYAKHYINSDLKSNVILGLNKVMNIERLGILFLVFDITVRYKEGQNIIQYLILCYILFNAMNERLFKDEKHIQKVFTFIYIENSCDF